MEQANKFDLKPHMCGSVEDFVQQSNGTGSAPGGLSILDHLESEIHDREKQLLELNRYNERLTQEYNEKVEFQVNCWFGTCFERICMQT